MPTGAATRKYLRCDIVYCADKLRLVVTTAGLYWATIESGLGLT